MNIFNFSYTIKTRKFYVLNGWFFAGWWKYTPLIPALRRQRQLDFCELETSLVYRARQPGRFHRETLSQTWLPPKILIIYREDDVVKWTENMISKCPLTLWFSFLNNLEHLEDKILLLKIHASGIRHVDIEPGKPDLWVLGL